VGFDLGRRQLQSLETFLRRSPRCAVVSGGAARAV
jgi:hypothetical protein